MLPLAPHCGAAHTGLAERWDLSVGHDMQISAYFFIKRLKGPFQRRGGKFWKEKEIQFFRLLDFSAELVNICAYIRRIRGGDPTVYVCIQS